jgi:hypothetical protein
MGMSYVSAAPAQIQAAAQNLAGIRSTLADASSSAVAPTVAVPAAAQDDVSAGVAAVFGAFGEDYQTFSAQMQTFHEQFLNLMNAGAGAYQSTDADAQQALLSAVNAPARELLGQSTPPGAAASNGGPGT